MKKRPGKITLVLTNACNLECIYCYEKQKYCGKMDFETAVYNIKEVMESKKYSEMDIYLFGGEPFLEFDLVKRICEWTWIQKWEIPYRFTISTNGTNLDKEKKEWLTLHREKLCVVLSLDGKKESHNINRCNSFDMIDIDFFKDNWPDSGIKMTVSVHTLPYLCENIKFIHSKGLRFSDCNLAMGIDWSDAENVTVLKEQLDELYNFYVKNPALEPANIIDLRIGACENEKEVLKLCGAGENIFVNTDGKIYPCNYINPMSFEEKDLEILMNLNFDNVEELEDRKCLNECYLYPLCPNCYAANYSLNGKVNERNKGICNLIKIQAVYSAKLLADRIKKIDREKLTFEEIGKLHKTILAVHRIIENYSAAI